MAGRQHIAGGQAKAGSDLAPREVACEPSRGVFGRFQDVSWDFLVICLKTSVYV